MYQWLSEISRILSYPFLVMLNETTHFPLLGAFVLGIIGAVAPCQLTGNIGAITFYGANSLKAKNQWLEVLYFLLGKMVVFSILGLGVWYIGQELQLILPNYFSAIRKFMGPLLVIIGLFLLGVIKFNNIWRRNSRHKRTYKTKGKWGSFLMGASFSLAFCPTMFSLFFFTLMPLVVSSSYGLVLPSVFAIGTTLPVIIVLALIFVLGFDGSLMKKSRKVGSIVQRGSGIVIILLGIFDTLTYWN